MIGRRAGGEGVAAVDSVPPVRVSMFTTVFNEFDTRPTFLRVSSVASVSKGDGSGHPVRT
jgi:hypothetical protein